MRIDFNVAGVTFEGRQGLLQSKYHKHIVASLRPEPENPHDSNAIAVYADDLKVGYVPKGMNEEVKRNLDKTQLVEMNVGYSYDIGKYFANVSVYC